MNKSSAGNERFCGDASYVDATASNHHRVAFNQGHFVVLPPQVHRQRLAALAASNDDGVVCFWIVHLAFLYLCYGPRSLCFQEPICHTESCRFSGTIKPPSVRKYKSRVQRPHLRHTDPATLKNSQLAQPAGLRRKWAGGRVARQQNDPIGTSCICPQSRTRDRSQKIVT